MLTAWREERIYFFSTLISAILVGGVTGYWLYSLLLSSIIYTLWHAWHFSRLLIWLKVGAPLSKAPDLPGAWISVVSYIYGVQRRHQQRKGRMRLLLDRFKQVAVALPDGTVVLRADNEIEWVNKVAESLLGIRHPQDIGRHIGNLIRNPAFHAYIKNAQFDEPLNIVSPRDKNMELSVRIIPFGDGEKLLTARDISSFVRVQAMRRDFVANVSHELRTPLTVMNGYLESLLDDGWDEEHQQILRSMQQQSTRMLHIVRDLLELSRLESDPRDLPENQINMPALLEAVCGDVQHLAQTTGHQLSLDVNRDLTLKGGEKELQSVIANLIHNALRHTPQGTRIQVKWYLDHLHRPVFRVDDNGRGIEKEHIPRLTERFYRVDPGRSRDAGGSGLGLSIVKHIVNRHGGTLEVESVPGQGASFLCLFPPSRGLLVSGPAKAI